jgi:hypothetical protein
MAFWRWMASFDGNLVTLEYTKKYNPYIYDFVYTPVISTEYLLNIF